MVLIWLHKVCKRGKLLKNKIGSSPFPTPTELPTSSFYSRCCEISRSRIFLLKMVTWWCWLRWHSTRCKWKEQLACFTVFFVLFTSFAFTFSSWCFFTFKWLQMLFYFSPPTFACLPSLSASWWSAGKKARLRLIPFPPFWPGSQLVRKFRQIREEN